MNSFLKIPKIICLIENHRPAIPVTPVLPSVVREGWFTCDCFVVYELQTTETTALLGIVLGATNGVSKD